MTLNFGINTMLTCSLSFYTAEECKKKWKTLRIQQRRIIIKKIKKNERRSAIQWNCYDALKFLIPHMDWTATDDIKKDPDLDLSMLSDICDDDEQEEFDETYENDENCESQSEDSSYASSPMDERRVQLMATTTTAAAQADSTIFQIDDKKMQLDDKNVQLMATTTPNQLFTGATVADNANKMNQYLLAYLPTAATATNQIQLRSDADNSMMTTTTNCVSINNQTVTAPMFADTVANTTTNPMENKYQMNNRIITVPVNAPTIVNYFLMDVAMQMERLNDIAQMEMKIEIHRLLLDKLRNPNNLRQTPSICFTTNPNPN